MPKTESKPSRKRTAKPATRASRAGVRGSVTAIRKPGAKTTDSKSSLRKSSSDAASALMDGEQDLSHLPEANRKALRELDAYVAAHPPRTELGRLAIELRRLCLLEGEKLLSDEEILEQLRMERGRN